MLKQTTKDKLKALGFDVDKLVAAATHAEEQDFEVPDIKNYSDADLETRDNNTKSEAAKEAKKEGKKDGIAIATKTIAEKFNIPVTDIDLARPETLIDKLNANFAKGDDGLKEQVKLLQADKVKLETDLSTADSNHKVALRDRDLLSKLPKNRLDLFNDDEYLDVVKKNLTIEDDNGVQVVKRNGEVLRDATTKNPIPVDKAIETLFTERKFISANGNGGRGGGDHQNNGGGYGGMKKLSQVIEKWEGEGKNSMSPEFQQHLKTVVAATTDFDMQG